MVDSCTLHSNFKLLNMKTIIFYLIMAAATSTLAQIKVGDTFPFFKLIASNGQEVIVTAHKTQFILVDFWASWCAPCRKKNKELVRLQTDNSKTDLVIIGISLDSDREKWTKAIEKDGIRYTQLNDPYGFDATTAIRFGVEQLPASYLFDKTGKLIAINPTLIEITNKLNLN